MGTADRLDLTRYVPYYLTAIGNAVTRGASRLYLRKFGVGITEWRLMSLLAIEADCTASRICQVISLDKAAASRSLRTLEEMNLICGAPTPDPRRRTYSLTADGLRLHDAIIKVALKREARLLEGVDPADLEATLRAFARMHANLSTVNQDDY